MRSRFLFCSAVRIFALSMPRVDKRLRLPYEGEHKEARYSHNPHSQFPCQLRLPNPQRCWTEVFFGPDLCISTCNALTLHAAPARPSPHLNTTTSTYTHTPCHAAALYQNPDASQIRTSQNHRPSSSGRFTACPLVAGTSTCNCFGVSSFYYCPLSAAGSSHRRLPKLRYFPSDTA